MVTETAVMMIAVTGTAVTATATVVMATTTAVMVTVTATATRVTTWIGEDAMGMEITVIAEIVAAKKETATVMSVGTETEGIDGNAAQTMKMQEALIVARLMVTTRTEVVGRDRAALTAVAQVVLVVMAAMGATVETKMAAAARKEAATLRKILN